jgi:hypothetical protein
MPRAIAGKFRKSEQHDLRKQRLHSMNFPDFYRGIARVQKSKIIYAQQICRKSVIFSQKLPPE